MEELIFIFIFSWLIGLVSLIGIGCVAYFILSSPFRRIDCATLVVELNDHELSFAAAVYCCQLFDYSNLDSKIYFFQTLDDLATPLLELYMYGE